MVGSASRPIATTVAPTTPVDAASSAPTTVTDRPRPPRSLARGCDAVNRTVGGWVAWFALAMVLVQFTVVVLRYVFGVGFIVLQESMNYLHGFMFLLGAGYTLLVGG